MRWTIESPSPAPPARRRSRRQKRRKINSRSCSLIPGPSSRIRTVPLSSTTISTVFPAGEWLIAFSTRLRTARDSISPLPWIQTGAWLPLNAMFLPCARASGAANSAISAQIVRRSAFSIESIERLVYRLDERQNLFGNFFRRQPYIGSSGIDLLGHFRRFEQRPQCPAENHDIDRQQKQEHR